MKDYICPNDAQHIQDGHRERGFQFVLEDIPEPHRAEVICTICRSHIKWASKAELKEQQITIESEKVAEVCPLMSILRIVPLNQSNTPVVQPCLKEDCAWWVSLQEACAVTALGQYATMKM